MLSLHNNIKISKIQDLIIWNTSDLKWIEIVWFAFKWNFSKIQICNRFNLVLYTCFLFENKNYPLSRRLQIRLFQNIDIMLVVRCDEKVERRFSTISDTSIAFLFSSTFR